MMMVNVAKRFTFVIGADRRILRIDEGEAAIEPTTAISACEMPPPTGK
jgi:thioredoxin-dependent peroxiredoxin